MQEEQIRSAAFQNAELQSERLRIFGVLGFAVIFILVMVLRVFVIRTAADTTPWVSSLLLAAIVIGYESWMLLRVASALKVKGGLPIQFWVRSTIVETSIPAFAIAFFASAEIEIVYRPLASPAVLVFFIFIILSTLRLNPWISAMSGTVAAVTYICATLYLGWRLPLPGAPAPVTQTSVSLNVIALFVGGVVAGAVAGQIRKHVQSALREEETRRKLEAIQHDLQVARSIQQSLPPQEPPQILGVDIYGWNRPVRRRSRSAFFQTSAPIPRYISGSRLAISSCWPRTAFSSGRTIRANNSGATDGRGDSCVARFGFLGDYYDAPRRRDPLLQRN